MSLIEESTDSNIFKISALYFCSSHSLEKELGTEIVSTPPWISLIFVFANQVAKLAEETFNLICASTDSQICSCVII